MATNPPKRRPLRISALFIVGVIALLVGGLWMRRAPLPTIWERQTANEIAGVARNGDLILTEWSPSTTDGTPGSLRVRTLDLADGSVTEQAPITFPDIPQPVNVTAHNAVEHAEGPMLWGTVIESARQAYEERHWRTDSLAGGGAGTFFPLPEEQRSLTWWSVQAVPEGFEVIGNVRGNSPASKPLPSRYGLIDHRSGQYRDLIDSPDAFAATSPLGDDLLAVAIDNRKVGTARFTGLVRVDRQTGEHTPLPGRGGKANWGSLIWSSAWSDDRVVLPQLEPRPDGQFDLVWLALAADGSGKTVTHRAGSDPLRGTAELRGTIIAPQSGMIAAMLHLASRRRVDLVRKKLAIAQFEGDPLTGSVGWQTVIDLQTEFRFDHHTLVGRDDMLSLHGFDSAGTGLLLQRMDRDGARTLQMIDLAALRRR